MTSMKTATGPELDYQYAYRATRPVCSGAIFWSNIQRVVYGLSQESLYGITKSSEDEFLLPCREVLARGNRSIEIIGPLLEEEAKGKRLINPQLEIFRQKYQGYFSNKKGVWGEKIGSKKPI